MKNQKEERKDVQDLVNTCDKKEILSREVEYTKEEMDSFKNQLVDVSINMDTLEDEKKFANDNFKGRMDALKGQRSNLLNEIKAGRHIIADECFVILNAETKMKEYYDKDGVLVGTKALSASESQKTIFQAQREAEKNTTDENLPRKKETKKITAEA